MMLGLLRAGALACVLLTSTAMYIRPAQAQGPSLSPPPETLVVSPGGVDMRSGRYAYSQTDLSIGPDEGGLALTRTMNQAGVGHLNPFANFSHNWDIFISEKRISVENNSFEHTPGFPGFQIEVSVGGIRETFRAPAASWGYQHMSRTSYAELNVAGAKASASAVYTLRLSDGTEAVFRPIGSNDCSALLRCAYVSAITQADGTRLDFEYDNAGDNATRLTSITSSRGYALLFENTGGAVVKACALNLAVAPKPANNICPSGVPTATYTYAASGGSSRLASATDAGGGTWGFINNATSQGFVRPGETVPWLTNTLQATQDVYGFPEEIVTSQSYSDGRTFAYGFAYAPVVAGQALTIAGGGYVDNAGNSVGLEYAFPTRPCNPDHFIGDCPPDRPIDENWSGPPFEITPGPVKVTDQLNRVTTTDYCDPVAMVGLPSNWPYRCYVEPQPVSTTSPSGIRTYMTWDFAGNLTQTRQVASGDTDYPGNPNTITRSATYNCTAATMRYCRKPVAMTDARGAVTQYDYDPVHGGLTRETGPAPTAGAPQPQTRHTYAQRHVWVSNGSGGYVQVATPIWVRTATSLCRTSAATGNPATPCATAGDEVRTAYDYGPDAGPNNLLLRGQAVTADGVTLRTCFTYDSQGRRIAETTPGAGLAQCQ